MSINFHSKNSNKPQIYLSTQKEQTRARFFGQSKLEKAPKFFTFMFSRLLGYQVTDQFSLLLISNRLVILIKNLIINLLDTNSQIN